MELEAKDGQLCIIKSSDQNYKISECQRLAKMANDLGRPNLEGFSSINTLSQAILTRYQDLAEFEIHALGLTAEEQNKLQFLQDKMKNINRIRFVGGHESFSEQTKIQ
jgi:hypothetical protein